VIDLSLLKIPMIAEDPLDDIDEKDMQVW
jgi:hypothetical protein